MQSLKLKLLFEEKLSTLDKKLSNMCWELFKDFQKEIQEEIFEELADYKYKITKL